MVRTQRFRCRGPGSIAGQGTKILQAMWHGRGRKKKSLKHLVVPESKGECRRDRGAKVTVLNDQSWNNVSNKINNILLYYWRYKV